jgi:hypothetical protein
MMRLHWQHVGRLLVALAALAAPALLEAQGVGAIARSWADDPPALVPLIAFGQQQSELRTVIPAYSSGRSAMLRTASAPDSPQGIEAQRRWYQSWLDELGRLDFDALGVEGKVDYIMLRNRIEFELALLDEPQQQGGNQGGRPVGAEGLRAHLAREMIAYTAEELIAIAEIEFAWMDTALIAAARQMGFGDDWRAAQEATKQAAVPPGQKPALIRDLMYQSEVFIEALGSITLPPLMSEIWRMGMRGPQGQLTNPFFTGGEQITISYPTDEMSHEDKLMSMRGNNPHFNRATVHHELIPGHGLQGFMSSRFNEHRSLFGGPFWGEGWALYWEFVLWDEGFPRGPEDEIGMLFWRMHRAARIVFSMSYHLGRMTEQECVDYLVERVGFERANAAAEVRRSIGAAPLYQAAYMVGGLQIRALYGELVDSGRMSAREFHDAFLQGGRMPIEMVRLRLTGEGLTRDYKTQWRFAGTPIVVDR